jgi:hypothetical protein
MARARMDKPGELGQEGLPNRCLSERDSAPLRLGLVSKRRIAAFEAHLYAEL